MSLNYYLGKTLRSLSEGLLQIPALPVTNAYPWENCWAYDIIRIARTRKLQYLIDGGANRGQTAGYLNAFFPAATIHSFEPEPDNAEAFRQKLESRSNIHLHLAALSSATSAIVLKKELSHECHHVVKEPGPNTIEVKSWALDDFARSHYLPWIDVLKLDLEGHEMAALEGSHELLAGNRIRCIYAEVGFNQSDKSHVFIGRLLDQLAGYGFCYSGLYDSLRDRKTRQQVYFANILLWNPSFSTPECKHQDVKPQPIETE